MLSCLGLRSRLMLLVLAALAPVSVLFAYSAAKNQQAVLALALAQSSLQSEVLLAAAHQQRLIDRVAQLLTDIASGPSIKDTRNRLCMQYLKNLQTHDSIYSNLGVIGLDGKLSCHAMATGAPGEIYIGDRTFYQQVLDGQKFSVGEYAVSRSTGKPGIAFGMPVYSSEGVLNGVAYASIDVGVMVDVMAADPLVPGAQLRIIDRQGVILAAHPSSTAIPGSPEADAQVLQAVQSGKPGVREAVDAAGVQQVYAYAPVGDQKDGLWVAISMPRDLLTAAPRDLLLTDFAALLAMTIFGMACAWAMGKRLVVNPANALLKESHEIARGNFLARVQPDASSRNEIGQLGRAFNRMAAWPHRCKRNAVRWTRPWDKLTQSARCSTLFSTA